MKKLLVFVALIIALVCLLASCGGHANHTHSFGEWEVTKNPSCSENGEKSRYCNCGERQTETIPALSHTYSGDLDATCEECGFNRTFNYTVNFDGVSCTVTGIGYFNGTELTVPEYINGYKVTAIGENAFSECTGLTKLVIPETTTTIGDRAFYGCTGLTEFTIPESVTKIGNKIFHRASNISTVYYNSSYGSSDNPILRYNNITKVVFGGKCVPSFILQDCSEVNEVVILDSVTSIGHRAFYDCRSLTEIVIPDSVASIGNGAFFGCSSLTKIEIPAAVTSIDYEAFRGCSSLTEIVIPEGVTSIGHSAFANCISLTEIAIPDSIISIESFTFYGCRSLTEIEIPAGVTSISSSAFSSCSSLTEIVIPGGVTSIGSGAFRDCISLTKIVIFKGITRISSYAFYGCSSLTDVYYTGTEEQWAEITIGTSNSYLKNATLHPNYIPE